jgi:hypothetical protein
MESRYGKMKDWRHGASKSLSAHPKAWRHAPRRWRHAAPSPLIHLEMHGADWRVPASAHDRMVHRRD